MLINLRESVTLNRHSRANGNPVNNRYHYSLELISPFSGVDLFFVRTKEKVRKESRPRYRILRMPSQLHDFLRSRKQDSCLGSAHLNVLFK